LIFFHAFLLGDEIPNDDIKKPSPTVETALVPLLHLYMGIVGTHVMHGGSGGNLPALKIIVASNVPVGAGLGSSAAYCTALAAAFLK
jgi:galactokinase